MFHSARLTRRELLKLGIVGGGMATLGGLAAQIAAAEDLIRGGVSPSRTTGKLRRAVPSTCGLCTARCGILGFVEEGRVVKIEGNPRDPNARGRICARGQAGVNRVHDPDRLLFPIERAGGRGEGKWTRISWEQAYDKLEARLRDLQERNPEGLVLHTGLEGAGLLTRRFAAAFGSPIVVDETCLDGANRETANLLSMGTRDEVIDVSNARYVLNFGGNPFESHHMYVPFVQRLVDAHASGAKLVTFDPRISLTAGRSDEWFPVLPGTDGLLALAMASVIVQQDLHNREFLSKWTDVPVDDLPRHLSAYTPEAAASASGLRADDIRRIATEFASVRPAVAIFGGGVTRQKGAVSTQQSVIFLNAVVGSVGARGGYCPAPAVSLREPDPVLSQTYQCDNAAKVVEELLRGNRSAGMYVTSLANPAYSWPDPRSFREMLGNEERVGYLVSIDTHLTETSSMADLVLPAATYLESWGLETPPPQDLVPYVTLRQPIAAPLGEALSVDDILLTLGTRLGAGASKFFAFPRIENYIDAIMSASPELAASGGLTALREQGVWYDLSATPSHPGPTDVFATGTGKLELSQVLKATAAAAPITDSSGGAEDEFTLVTYRPNVHSGDYTANCWWLAEIAHDNSLLINLGAAERLGLHPGQRVRLVSPAGALDVPVRMTAGIHPRVVALASGFGHEALGRIAQSLRPADGDPIAMHIWWDKDGSGVNAGELIQGRMESPGGGLVWMDTTVRIETRDQGRAT